MTPAAPPFAHTLGPRTAPVVLVGEAWDTEEAKLGLPFIGQSGKELDKLLKEADIPPGSVLKTTVLARQPPGNDLDKFCGSKTEVGKDYGLPALRQGKYLRREFLPEVDRLHAELSAHPRKLILALGNTACWAILRQTKISQIRGAVVGSPFGKVLPTYHPAAVLRDWSLRVIVLADLMKARREAEFPDIRRPEREILVNPTLAEIWEWIEEAPIHGLAVDIETKLRQITSIGFARSPSEAVVIPFVDMSKPGHSFWPDEESELAAWAAVAHLLEHPAPKVFQNGLYDLQYIARMGLRVWNCQDDTMLLHHALYPELPKGLGFLGSVYTDEASWKLMRLKNHEELKKDE